MYVGGGRSSQQSSDKFFVILSLPILYHWGLVSFPDSGQTGAGNRWPLERGGAQLWRGWNKNSFGVHRWLKKSVHLESTLDTHTSEPPAHYCLAVLTGKAVGFAFNLFGAGDANTIAWNRRVLLNRSCFIAKEQKEKCFWDRDASILRWPWRWYKFLNES